MSGTSRRGRILVVDDERTLGVALRRLLGGGHDVVVVHSGAEAQRYLRLHGDLDLILCDVNMPGMSGIALHRWLVDVHPLLAERLVFMSGAARAPRSIREQIGGQEILTKPFDAGELADLVRRRIR